MPGKRVRKSKVWLWFMGILEVAKNARKLLQLREEAPWAPFY